MTRYTCDREGNQHFVLIETDKGGHLDMRKVDSKFAGMQLRDTAAAAGVTSFDELDGKPAPKAVAPEPTSAEQKAAADAEAEFAAAADAAAKAEAEDAAAAGKGQTDAGKDADKPKVKRTRGAGKRGKKG